MEDGDDKVNVNGQGGVRRHNGRSDLNVGVKDVVKAVKIINEWIEASVIIDDVIASLSSGDGMNSWRMSPSDIMRRLIEVRKTENVEVDVDALDNVNTDIELNDVIWAINVVKRYISVKRACMGVVRRVKKSSHGESMNFLVESVASMIREKEERKRRRIEELYAREEEAITSEDYVDEDRDKVRDEIREIIEKRDKRI
ncbi:MAG: hypothetical protein DRH44_07475 [Candidatus Coatesbacteria bacterium]|nr:MAG: hypothetical protein DRH44_07475 [Candidatus Coatesbacteria bacterium]